MFNIKILLVDKDKKFLKLAEKNLLEITKDFQISTCTSAEQALEILKGEKYHAVLSEHVLPEMNGLKFLSNLRKKGDNIPFIIFTSESRENEVIKALNLGVNYYIKKDNSKDQFKILVKEIEKLIEKKESFEFLQTSNEKYQLIFSEAKNGIVLINAKTGQIMDGNKEFEKQTGRSIKDLRQLKIWDFRPPEKRELAKKKFIEISNLRRSGSSELDFLKPNGEKIQISFISNFITVDNIEYIQSMTTDITKMRNFQEELSRERNIRQKYLDIIDSMIVVVDINENIIFVNKKSCEILGYKENEILGKNWFNIFLSENIRGVTRNVFRKVLNEELIVESYENIVLTKNGEEKLISWKNSVLKNDNGKVIASLSSGSDITFRRKIHSELIESENKFRTLFEDIPIGVGIFDSFGRVIRVNKKMLEITGYTKETILEINVSITFYNPNDQKRLRKILLKNEVVVNFETKLLQKDGTVYDALLNINKFREKDEVFSLTFCQDITKFKQLEVEQISLLKVIEHIDDSILITDEKGEIIYVNPGFEKFTGYSYLDAVNQTPAIMRYIDEEFDEDYYANIVKTTFSGKTWKGRLKIKRKDGKIRIGDRIITPIKDNSGKFNRFIGITKDITNQVIHEKELADSQKHFRSMFEDASLLYQSLNKEGLILDVNEFWLKSLGYTEDEVLGKCFGDFLTPDFVVKFEEIFSKFIERGEIHDIHFDMVTKDGETLSVYFDGKIKYNDEVEMERLRYVFIEKKFPDDFKSKINDLLEKQTLLHESANLGTWDWDIETGDFIINKPYVEMLGYSLDEIEPNIESVRKLTHKDNSCVSDLILNLPKKDIMKLISVEHRAICKSGDIKWIQCIGKVVEHDKQGNPTRAIGLHLDITDKKTSLLKVVESEIRYRKIFEHINEVFFITNTDGTIIDLNPKGETLFGYSRVEILELNIADLYANPKDRIEFKKTIEKQGFLRNFELKMKRKDGTIIDVFVNGTVRRNQNAIIIGYIGIIRDISKNKELEENILNVQEQFDKQTSKLINDLQEKLDVILQTSSSLESESSDYIKEQVSIIISLIAEYRKSIGLKID